MAICRSRRNALVYCQEPDLLDASFILQSQEYNSKKKLPLNRAHTTKDVPVFPLGVTAYIDIIAVAESSKRKGVGKLIVKHCVEFAKEKGLRFINLTVDAHNRNAIEFYNKLDFSVVLYNPSSESYVLSLPLETRGN